MSKEKAMSDAREALRFLEAEIGKKKRRGVLSFNEYLELVEREPKRILRNIFQLFYDLVKSHVIKGKDDYPGDPESIGFVKYDCAKLFVQGADNPFFADTLFANRFVRQVEGLRQGFQQNRIYVYDGPSGCGKSTFLNNLLRTFEAYTHTQEGQIFEIVWEMDESLFRDAENSGKFVVPCPSHDYPILVIPKEYRARFLEKILAEAPEIRSRIFGEKDYEWIFQGEVCTFCKSIFWSSLEKLGSLDKVLNLVKAKPYKFDRRLGEGISIFNPGDKPIWGAINGRPTGGYFGNKAIQDRLDQIFGINAVKYTFSSLAKTNNGIYVLMDIKLHNEERLRELHNVISEGVHKVGDIEERINSLFVALMNPEDKEILKTMKSFEGRIQYNKIPFVLEPSTEVDIYRNIYGASIDESFLPRVMENFARVIIASRMNTDCQPLKEWIPDISKYKRYCDENGLLLRMALYSDIIPSWLSEEDRKKFTAPIRQAIIAEGEKEGDRGFDGRNSLELFREFFNRYKGRPNLINMDNVVDFFKHKIGRERRNENIPKNFLASLTDSYDYAVLNEVKAALYFHNTEQISKDILNYLCAINYDPGNKVKCQYTDEEFEVTLDFLKLMASRLAGREMKNDEALRFAQEIQKKYITRVAREQKADIKESDLYQELFKDYVKNLEDKVLEPFIRNKNFREAIKSYGNEEFKTFDARLKEHVAHMIQSLISKFGYTEQGAKEICLYVIDNKVAENFA